ncbi:glycosyltransferase [Devosia sp. 1566]|uniref:glycosyltransferase n=1 Tax=Devosia sp. 1566 TaxID=2499144 RepID=UPI000FDCA5BB|nr:glycosyltransferase [Devosia sp. 1566]
MNGALTFVIPAYNAAGTIRDTLKSLVSQGRTDWNALVVDDGSTDATLAIVSELAASEPRIKIIRSQHLGVCGARNAGLSATWTEWVCFLDADDRVLPHYVERMMAAARNGADLVYCGYDRVTTAGELLLRNLDASFERLGFACVARYCPVSIHCVATRTRVLSDLGGFDPALEVCEDWDLWQRAARTGIRIRMVPEALAIYVASDHSLSFDNARMLRDGLKVLRQGHAADPRVRRPATEFAIGLAPDGLPAQAFYFACWCAAAEVGAGRDGTALLAEVASQSVVNPGINALGEIIANGIIVGSRQPSAMLAAHWGTIKPQLLAMVERLWLKLNCAGFDTAILYAVECCILGLGGTKEPRHLDLTCRLAMDLSALRTIQIPSDRDLVIVDLMANSRHVGTVKVGSFGGITDKVVAESAIEKLGVRHFIRHSHVWDQPKFWLGFAGGLLREAASAGSYAWRTRSTRHLGLRARGGAVLRRAALDLYLGCSRPVTRSVMMKEGGSASGMALAPPSTTAGAPLRKPPASAVDVWEDVFSSPDPWQYASDYEQQKYQYSLDLLPEGTIHHALELACAEGHFTVQLASRVTSLIAADISPTAITRARQRCEGLENVEFRTLDLIIDPLPHSQDVIFCSEVLYYLDGVAEIAAVAGKLRDALALGGQLIMANHFLLKDDMTATGFDWDQNFGAKVLHQQFLATPGLQLARSLVTELYRVDVFKRCEVGSVHLEPQLRRADLGCTLETSLKRNIVWGGAILRRREVEHHRTWTLPILAYHRIATEGPEELRQWRVGPGEFEKQMRLLRANGYHAISSEHLIGLRRSGRSLNGRPVLITFDDAYLDTATTAWPILEGNDFTAEVFVPTDLVGKEAAWDARFGPGAALMDWDTITRLHDEGMRFGSHLASHTSARHLSSKNLLYEAVKSREVLMDRLQVEINSIAAPYGAIDDRFIQICKMAGYQLGYSCENTTARISRPNFILPRIEVDGSWDLEQFASFLSLDPNRSDASATALCL